MKIKNCILLSVLLAMMPAIVSAEVYLREDFNEISTGIPAGWNNDEGTTIGSAYKWSSYSAGYSGRCVRFNSFNNPSGRTNYLKTYPFSLTTAADLTFRYKNPNGGAFEVYVSADGGATFLDNVLISDMRQTKEWTEFRVSLEKYNNIPGICVVFGATSNYGSSDAYIYLDDVEVADAPTCARAEALYVSSLGRNSVEFSWSLADSGAEPASYHFSLSDRTGAVLQERSVAADGSYTMTVQGLDHNTTYIARLRSDCNSSYQGSAEWSEPLRFTTMAQAAGVPYSENFDSTPTTMLPTAWRNDAAPGSDAEVQLSKYYGAGGRALRLKTSSSASSIVLTPMFSHAADDLQFSAMMCATKRTPFSVGVMTDISDPSTFVAIASDTLPEANTWYDIRLNTYGGYYGAADTVCFFVMLPAGLYTLYIDDVNITPIPVCPRPERLHTDTVSATRALLSFSYHKPALGYQLQMRTGDSVITATSRTNPFPLANLAPSTEYSDVRIRALCSRSDTSEWSHPISFTTTTPVVIPTCPDPADIRVAGYPTTSTMGAIAWTGPDMASDWIVEYRLVTPDKVVTKQFLTDQPSFDIDSLISGTSYSVTGWVAAFCGVGDTSGRVQFARSFSTKCDITYHAPFLESFDNTQFPPACWTQRQTVQSSSQTGHDYGDKCWVRNTSSTYIASGAGSARLQDTRNGTHTILVSPQIELDTSRHYSLSYWQYRNSNSKPLEGVAFWINTVPDTVGGLKISYIKNDKKYPPTESKVGMYRYSFDIPDSWRGMCYIIAEGISQYGTSSYIDEIAIEERSLCPPIDEAGMTAIGYDYAEVTAKAEGRWELQYGPRGFSCGNGTVITPQSDTALVKPLLPDTEYDIYLRRICDEEEGLWSQRPIRFRTNCAPFVVDNRRNFVEDFENFANMATVKGCNIQTGNQMLEAHSDYSNYSKQIYISPYEGNRMAYITATGVSSVLRPLYLTAGQNYEISIAAVHGGSGTGPSTVSFVFADQGQRDKNETSTISAFAMTTEWEKRAAYFSVPATGVYYVGFIVRHNSANNVAAVDNFQVRRLACVPPTRVVVTEITSESARLVLTSDGNLWQCRVGTQKFNPAAEDTYLTDTTITSASLRLDNLRPNTQYYYSFRTLCANGESEWLPAASFRTACSAFSSPYSEGFESEDNAACWLSIGNPFRLISTSAHGGRQVMRLEGGMAITPAFDVENLGRHQIRGYVRSSVENAVVNIGVSIDAYDVAGFELIETVVTGHANTWRPFVVYFNSLANAEHMDFFDARHIAFDVPEGMSVDFDDLEVSTAPQCRIPSQLKLLDVSGEACSVEWVANGDEKSWKVSLWRAGELVRDTVVNQKTARIDNLAPLTTYEISVEAMCDDGSGSGFVSTLPVRTLCAVSQIPYDNDFNAIPDGQIPECWNTGESGNGNEMPWSVLGHKLRFQSSSTYNKAGYSSTIHTPMFSLHGWAGAILKMNVCNFNSDTLQVSLSTDGGYTYNITLAEVAPQGSRDYSPLSCDLTPFINTNICIAITSSASGTLSSFVDIDDFVIEPIEECVRPTKAYLLDITDKSVEFYIEDDSDNAAWEYTIGVSGFDYQASAPILVRQPEVVASGLTPQTNYQIFIRAACAGEHSSWRGPLEVTTDCGSDATIPYVQDFENISSIEHTCLRFDTDKPASSTYPSVKLAKKSISSDAAYVASGNQALKFTSSSQHSMLYILPEFDLATNMLRMMFDYRNESSATNNTRLQVGVLAGSGSVDDFFLIKEFDISATFRSEVVDFSQLYGDKANGRIAFRYGPGVSSNYYLGLDNIVVMPAPGCPDMASPVLLSADSASAVVGIGSAADTMQLIVTRNPEGFHSADTVITTSNNHITINNLSSGTDYYAYARSICPPDTGAWSPALLFSASCGVVDIPRNSTFEERFDGCDSQADPFPSCFLRVRQSHYNGTSYPRVTNSNKYNGYPSLFMRGVCSMALPRFSAENHHLKLSTAFMGSGSFEIGFQDSPDATAEFTVIQRFTASSSFLRREVDLSLSGEKGRYIVVRTTAQNAQIYIADIIVEWADACFSPRRLMVEDITDTAATLHWTLARDAVTNEAVLISPAATDSISLGSEEVLRLDGLAPRTGYQVMLRSICLSGDTTEWAVANFTTTQTAAKAPYFNGFESDKENKQWDIDDSAANHFVIGSAAEAVRSGEHSLYITKGRDLYAYNNGAISYDTKAYRLFELEAGNYKIEYDWRCNGETNYDYARLLLVDDATDIASKPIINTAIGDPRWIELDDGQLQGATDWNHKSVSFRVPRHGLYKLVLGWNNNSNRGEQPPMAIDNIRLQSVGCFDVDAVTLLSLSSTSARIKVRSTNGDARVVYRVTTTNSATARPVVMDTVDVTGDDEITITGLLPESRYYVFVRSICNDKSVSNSWKSMIITTLCPPFNITRTQSFLETFEGMPHNKNISTCLSNRSLSSSANRWKSYNAPADHGRKAYAGTGYAALANSSNAHLMRNFILDSAEYEFSVMTMMANMPGITLEVLYERNGEEVVVARKNVEDRDYAMLRYRFRVETSGEYNVGVRATTSDLSWYVCIDNMSLSKLSDALPSHLTIDSVDSRSVSLSWGGQADRYRLMLSDDKETVLDTIINATSLSYGGLRPQRDYTASLWGQLIEKEEVADQSRAVTASFSTPCQPNDAPLMIIHDTICPGLGYTTDYFSLPLYQTTIPGDYSYSRMVESPVEGECERHIQLELHISRGGAFSVYDTICSGEQYTHPLFPEHVFSEPGTYVNEVSDSLIPCQGRVYLYLREEQARHYTRDTICEGEQYVFHGRPVTTPGLHTEIVQNSRGCDMADVLELIVLPREIASTHKVCSGGSLQWGDTLLTTTGRYQRRYTNIRGCDSIVAINFIVIPDTVFTSASICHGDSYLLGNTPYNQSGTYTSSGYVNALGCDSVSVLTLVVEETDTAVITDYVCQGREYYGHNIMLDSISADTTFTHSFKTLQGCDSVRILHLRYQPTVYDTITDFIQPEGTYDFGGNTYTRPGIYTARFFSEHDCDSIVTLVLQIGTGTGLNTYAPHLVLAPNPATFGQIVAVDPGSKNLIGNGATAEVIDALGQIVFTERITRTQGLSYTLHATFPPGVYFVRITSSDGEAVVGKLVVE